MEASTDIRSRCIAAYRETPDVRAVAASLGLPTIRAYLHLAKSGVLLTEDRARIGSAGARLGAHGEMEFKRLVPAARDMNAEVRDNHPGYDFMVGSKTIDVKAHHFSIARGKNRRPSLQVGAGTPRDPRGKGADIYVVFALLKKDFSDGYRLFAVPAELIGERRYICITQGVPSLWDGFELAPEELSDFLHALVGEAG